MDALSRLRVLSIQSHVAHGCVGNRAAAFALEVLGLSVDVVNTCNLSNHTGYRGGAHGPRASAGDLADILRGLSANGLLRGVTHVLSGYAANAAALRFVLDALRAIDAAAPARATYVCDPVLGDNGVLYVPAALVEVYRAEVLPRADVLTPNCFELGLLAGVDAPACEADAFAACDALHASAGVPVIVVTGAVFACSPRVISVLVSEKGGRRAAVDAAVLDMRFTGSGDLTAALVLACGELHPGDRAAAYTRVMATVSAILDRTLQEHRAREHPKDPMCKMPELRLAGCVAHLLDPPHGTATFREVPRE